MGFRNALGLESGGDRIEALNDRHSSGKRRDLALDLRNRQVAPPQTAMRDAFSRALVRWAATRRSGRIVLPTGVVDGDELALVLRVPDLIEDTRRAP
jgi:hypothetical protein